MSHSGLCRLQLYAFVFRVNVVRVNVVRVNVAFVYVSFRLMPFGLLSFGLMSFVLLSVNHSSFMRCALSRGSHGCRRDRDADFPLK